MATTLVLSPWEELFDSFVRSIKRHALFVSPFISGDPLKIAARHLLTIHNPTIEILTNLAVPNLIEGITDPVSIIDFCKAIPSTSVRHLPSLHAKVYVADDTLAVITSANLTNGGIRSNYEYGILLDDPSTVIRVSQDLREYAALGIQVSFTELTELAEVAQDLRHTRSELLASTRSKLRREFERRIGVVRERLQEMRAKPGESAHAIFTRTILYLLKGNSLTTEQLNNLIQQIHPDLCDDTIDRVIRGVRFGKRWKHMVRSAQAHLKRQGKIHLHNGKWELMPTRG